jgi:uncharacterized protein (TIGR04255 family)
MTAYPHLNRAPITEAALDIRVEAEPGVVPAMIEKFAIAVKQNFPDQKPFRTVEAVFTMASDKPAEAESQTTGVGKVCWNVDKTRAVQARTDGFSLNHVRLYGSWEELRGHAKEMWPQYVDLVKPKAVTRIALRYINRLDFPSGEDLASRLRTMPVLSRNLPQLVNSCLMRVEIPFDHERRAIITEATLPTGPQDVRRGLILDIDAFVFRHMAPGDTALWDEFEALHDIKNCCFFESLQPETWKGFQS